MLEYETAKSFLASGEYEITHHADIPYVELKSLQGIAPPGMVYPVRDLIQLAKEVERRLLDLAPGSKSQYAVGFTHDFRRAALARFPTAQQQINLKEGGDKATSLEEIASEEGATSRHALEVAEKIYEARKKGDIRNIEDYRSMLKASPAPQVTRKVLSSYGRPEVVVVQDNQEHLTGGGESFPRQLDSPTRYVLRVEIKSGVDEVDRQCKVRVLECEALGETALDLSGRRIPLLYLEQDDGLTLLSSQLSRTPAQIEVSVTFDTLEDTPKHMTLWRVLNQEEVKASLLNSLQQTEIRL